MASGIDYIRIGKALSDLYFKLDTPIDQSAIIQEEVNIVQQIATVFEQIVPALQQINGNYSDQDLTQKILDLRVLFDQDQKIYEIVSKSTQYHANFFRTYRLKNQIELLRNCRTEHVAKDLIRQITTNLEKLVEHHQNGSIENTKWKLINDSVQSIEIPSFVDSSGNTKNYLNNGVLKGLLFAVEQCMKLTKLFQIDVYGSSQLKQNIDHDKNINILFEKTLRLIEEQDFSFKELIDTLGQLPLFFEQNEKLSELIDKKSEARIDLRLTRLKMQLETKATIDGINGAGKFSDDFQKQIRSNIYFFVQQQAEKRLSDAQRDEVLELLKTYQLVTLDVNNLRPEILFLCELAKVKNKMATYQATTEQQSNLHKEGEFKRSLIEFQELASRYQKNVSKDDWQVVCKAIANSNLPDHCQYEFLKVCLNTDVDLALDLIQNCWDSGSNEDLKRQRLGCVLSTKASMELVSSFKEFIKSYREINHPWDELCPFFIGKEYPFNRRLSLLRDSGLLIAPKQLIDFLGNYYLLASGDEALFNHLMFCIKKQPHLIASLRLYLVNIALEKENDGLAKELLQKLKEIDSSPDKIEAKIEELHLLFMRYKHLHNQNQQPNEIFEFLKPKFQQLAVKYANREVPIDRWRAILNEVIQCRNIFTDEQYLDLKQIAIKHPQREPTPIEAAVTYAKSILWRTVSKQPLEVVEWDRKFYEKILRAYQKALNSKQNIDKWLRDENNPVGLIGVRKFINLIKGQISEDSDKEVLKKRHDKIINKLGKLIESESFKDNTKNMTSLSSSVTKTENGYTRILLEACKTGFEEIDIYDYRRMRAEELIKKGLKELESREPFYSFHLAENVLRLDKNILHEVLKVTVAPGQYLITRAMSSVISSKVSNDSFLDSYFPFLMGTLERKTSSGKFKKINFVRLNIPIGQNETTGINSKLEAAFANRSDKILYVNFQGLIPGFMRVLQKSHNICVVSMCPNMDWLKKEMELNLSKSPEDKLLCFRQAFSNAITDSKYGYHFPKNYWENQGLVEYLHGIRERMHHILFNNRKDLTIAEYQQLGFGLNLAMLDYFIALSGADTLFMDDHAGLYSGSFIGMLFALLEKEGEQYEEFLNVLIHSAAIIETEKFMSENFVVLKSFLDLLENRVILGRLKEKVGDFKIKGFEIPFEQQPQMKAINLQASAAMAFQPASAPAEPLE